MNLPWERYPAGAKVFLFDGAIVICVANYHNRLGNLKWCAMLNLSLASGGGALYPADKLDDPEDAIIAAEQWLKNHMEQLLKVGS